MAKPLAARGVDVDADALDAVVEDSQHYPYFIQLWGEALWDRRLATGTTRLTASHAEAARPHVIARVTDYYQDRYLELDQSGWLAAGEQVAARFQSMRTLTYAELKAAIVDGLAPNPRPESVHAALDELQRLGFVWCPPGQPSPVQYEPGIPSLMAHVLDCPPSPPVRRPEPERTTASRADHLAATGARDHLKRLPPLPEPVRLSGIRCDMLRSLNRMDRTWRKNRVRR